jgi:hypothetical protein
MFQEALNQYATTSMSETGVADQGEIARLFNASEFSAGTGDFTSVRLQRVLTKTLLREGAWFLK